MQIQTPQGSFLGWGTYKGEGSGAQGGNCADHYGPGWGIYFEGENLGGYFCRSAVGTLSSNSTHNFALRYGNCSGNNKWRAVLNGVLMDCSKTNGTTASGLAAGAEVVHTTSILNVNVRYQSLDRYVTDTATWIAWTSNVNIADTCETAGYEVVVNAPDDITVRKIP